MNQTISYILTFSIFLSQFNCFTTFFEKMVLFYFSHWKFIKWVCNECILLETRLAPTITNITSTTSKILVYWSHPSSYYDLLSNYEVTWKANGSSGGSSGLLERTIKEYTVSRHLMAGQLYIVNVITYAYRTNPATNIVVKSSDASVRLGMIYLIFLLI